METRIKIIQGEAGILTSRLFRGSLTVSGVALLTTLGMTAPAFATIDNTVTARGTSPGGTANDVTAQDSESVDVEDTAPDFTITKVATQLNGNPLPDPDNANAVVGDVVTYTYTFTNSGNTTINNVSFTDAHAGLGTLTQNNDETLTDNGTTGDSSDSVSGNGTWSSLAPEDVVTWTASYTVEQGDIDNNGGGDGNIDNTATFTATPVAGDFPVGKPLDVSEELDLDTPAPSILVDKLATAINRDGTITAISDPDNANVQAGDIITYTYTVTNNGTTTLTNINLVDNVTAGSGTAPTPANETLQNDNGTSGDSVDGTVDDGNWDTLGVGDVITFTGTYTVTQDDVDTLQ